MKKVSFGITIILILVGISVVAYGDTVNLPGTWVEDRAKTIKAVWPEAKSGELSMPQVSSRLYLVNSGPIPEGTEKPIYGGALNLKYFSGVSYDYLQERIAGKTLSVDVLIPEDLVGVGGGSNRLRVTIKSEKEGEWADYYTDESWQMIREPGVYTINIKIPEEPVQTQSGTTFYPDNTILITIEYDIFDKTKKYENVIFAFYNFGIEGVELDPDYLKWQFVDAGYTVEGVYLPDFAAGSTAIYSMGNDLLLDFNQKGPIREEPILPGTKKEAFLTMKVFVPEELRLQKGRFALTINDEKGQIRSSVKSFDSCNLEGEVYLTVQLDDMIKDSSVRDMLSKATIDLRVKTHDPHVLGMMPFIVSPIKVKQGQLIPFDNRWRLKDIQGRGAYSNAPLSTSLSLEADGFSSPTFGENPYQLDFATKLKGGIDWENPYYRVELIRDLEGAPLDLDNMHLEVIMSPLTDTTDSWQKPFRARIGVQDVNGAFMFGPNISLSEGLPSTAFLDISINNPIPKGIASPGFDPTKIKTIVLNFEASHGPQPLRDLKISLVNLSISPREYPSTSPIKVIDFSRQPITPEKWQLTELIKKSGGYLVGINFPFPVVDVPEDVLKVPQVYPCVGMKPTDPRHFGISGKDGREATLKTFKIFAEQKLPLVRILVLGHLEGVFEWGPKGVDIKNFGQGIEDQVQIAAGMSVEKLAEFLNENEETFFIKDDSGNILGLEQHVLPDFVALLDVLEEIENDTGHRITVNLALFDFLIGDGSDREGPLRIYTVGEHPEVVTDQLIKTKALCLTWKLMRDLSKDPRFYKYVSIVEIMNEPANATELSTRKHFPDLLNFVGEGMYLLKDAIGPDVPVTVGFRSWPEDLRYWAPIGDGVDILIPHYWESLESYNIDVPELWLLDTPVKRLWDYLGQKPGDRPTGMGEIAPSGKLKKNLFRLETAGYDFSLIWSFSGHDGHDAKPVIDKIGEYQKSNMIFATVRAASRKTRVNAFIYLKTAHLLFELQEKKEHGTSVPEGSNERFLAFMDERLGHMKNEELKTTLSRIMEVASLRDIPLSQENIQFLSKRALKED